MAFEPNQAWRIRTDGNELNGGGFDSNYGSTDYSDQASPQLSLTDIVTIGTQTVTSVTGGFTSAMEGNTIRIAGDGYYRIDSRTNTNTIQVDRNTGTATGQSARVGGAWADFRNASTSGGGTAPLLASPVIPGNTIHVRGTGSTNPSSADYALDGDYHLSDGDETSGPVHVLGYNGTPCITSPRHRVFLQQAYYHFYNLKFLDIGGGDRNNWGFISGNSGTILAVANCRFDQAGHDVAMVNVASAGLLRMTNCILENTGSGGVGSYAAVEFGGGLCYIAGCSLTNLLSSNAISNLFVAFGSTIVMDTLIAGCGGSGIEMTSDDDARSITFNNVTFHNNSSAGITLLEATGVGGATVTNCIFSNNGTYGIYVSGSQATNDRFKTVIDYNNFYNNSSGARSGIGAGVHDLAVDPQYVNAGSYDFTPQNTALRGVGSGSVMGTATNYFWIGVVQAAVVLVLKRFFLIPS